MEQYIKSSEVAKRLGIGHSTVARWRENGILKPERKSPTGTYLYSISQIERLIKQMEEGVNK